jgi:hypothetical protein
MRWSGEFNAPVSGTWRVKTTSDDGSRVYVDGMLIVDNDGDHGMRTKEYSGKMIKGWHKLVIVFYVRTDCLVHTLYHLEHHECSYLATVAGERRRRRAPGLCRRS